MNDATRELAFEQEIAEYLAAHGWEYSPDDTGYDAERALFPEDLLHWLSTTQPEQYAKVVTVGGTAQAAQEKLLLDAIVKRLDTKMEHGGGTLNALRRPFQHVNAQFRLCQFAPATTLNPEVTERYGAVRLRVMRQVHFSRVKGDNRSIDLVFFVNGLPVATAELKTFFKQEVRSAIDQYRKDRDPKDQPLLGFGTRALVHFAVDDDEVWMTTRLAGPKTYFLPFNQGTLDGGKGNPANPDGPASSYLWERVLQRDAWLHILGSLMFLRHDVDEDPITGRQTKRTTLIFPRFHQWEATTRLVAATRAAGPGARYLIQHSAGSGKTNTIAWTAHGLSRLHAPDNTKVFDKVLVISDRRVLDQQLQDAVRQVDDKQESVVTIDDRSVRAAGGSKSKALSSALTGEALVVVVTIQTFPFVMQEMTTTLAGRTFAVIVDEAHTSQSGATAGELRKVLAEGGVEVPEGADISAEDIIDAKIAAAAAAKAAPSNISFYAFTATPKTKTMELFGRIGPDGLPEPFHLYSMRQAIEEEFILDVLRGYQTYKRAFRIEQRAATSGVATRIPDGELVDAKAARREIMRFVDLDPANIQGKVEIVVQHFLANVAGLLDGHAKAMVVTSSRLAAVLFKRELDAYLRLPAVVEQARAMGVTDLGALVAFSGSVTDDDHLVEDATEHSENPGAGSDLAREFRRPKWRFMVVAEKFQTGFDQPLLTAMYIDKKLSDVYTVQTLSRLNRTYRAPSGEKKDRTFVLDFVNDPDEVQKEFEKYYREAHVEERTDPNAVHALATKLALADIYTAGEVKAFGDAHFGGASHGRLAALIQPPKDRFAERYAHARSTGDTDEIDRLHLFRGDVNAFVRLYDFMSQVVDFGSTDLERLAVFLRQLAAVIETDRLSSDVDVSDLVLAHVKHTPGAEVSLSLGGADVPLPAISPGGGSSRIDVEKVLLADVVAKINDLFGGEFDAEILEGFVKPVAAEALDDALVADQIDQNAEDQFLDSPDLQQAVVDAALGRGSEFQKLVGHAAGEDPGARQFVRLIGRYMYQLRKTRRAA